MPPHRYSRASRRGDRTIEQVLDAAQDMVRAGEFHSATMEDLASRAGVSRATLFARFGSRLGVLDALNVRCADSTEIAELHRALGIEDPAERLHAVIAASCKVWERWGDVQRHLRAVVVLEPEVRPLIEAQREFQRSSLRALADGLARDERLVSGISANRAAVTLHMLTGLEAFVELRHEGGLSLDATIVTLRRLAAGLLRG